MQKSPTAKENDQISARVNILDESLHLINNIDAPLQIHYSGDQDAINICHLAPTGLLCTFCEGRGLGCVRHAELALLPAAVVTDQGVVGLLDVHVIANTKHVTGSLDM